MIPIKRRPELVCEVRMYNNQAEIKAVTRAWVIQYWGWMVDHLKAAGVTKVIWWDYDSTTQGDFPGDPLTFAKRCPIVDSAADEVAAMCFAAGIALGFCVRGGKLDQKVHYLDKRFPCAGIREDYVDSADVSKTTAISVAFPDWLLALGTVPLVEFQVWGSPTYAKKKGWWLRIAWDQAAVARRLPAWMIGVAGICVWAGDATGTPDEIVAEILAFNVPALQITCHCWTAMAFSQAITKAFQSKTQDNTDTKVGTPIDASTEKVR